MGMYSTPGVVVPRRLQVSHDHSHVTSHVMPTAAQQRDGSVAIAEKPYKYSQVKDTVKTSSSSVAMDTSTDSACNDDTCYDGKLCVLL